MSDSQRPLSPEEVRERQEKLVFDVLDIRIFLAGVAFIGTLLEKKRFCAALKEARHMWRLDKFQRR